MACKIEPRPRQLRESELLAKENAIRENMRGISRLNQTLCTERAGRAIEWIQQNKPDLTFGVPGKLLSTPDDDHYGLSDLEDQGRAGNAVMVHASEIGQIWWCDPEDKVVDRHEFLVFVFGPNSNASYLIRFAK